MADEWVTQLLRQGDAKVFKKYSQMKLQMKREALAKIAERRTKRGVLAQERPREGVLAQFWHSWSPNSDGGGTEPSGSALFVRKLWSHPPGLNRRPTDYEFRCLPTKKWPLMPSTAWIVGTASVFTESAALPF